MTNTFITSIGSLITSVATLIYIIRTKKGVDAAHSDVQVIKETIENGHS